MRKAQGEPREIRVLGRTLRFEHVGRDVGREVEIFWMSRIVTDGFRILQQWLLQEEGQV